MVARLVVQSPRVEALEARRLLSQSPPTVGFDTLPFDHREPPVLVDTDSHSHSGARDHGGASLPQTPLPEAEANESDARNNTQASAQFLPGFGTGHGEDGAIDINGSLGGHAVQSAEDDGAIPLANDTGLVAGDAGRVAVSDRPVRPVVRERYRY